MGYMVSVPPMSPNQSATSHGYTGSQQHVINYTSKSLGIHYMYNNNDNLIIDY